MEYEAIEVARLDFLSLLKVDLYYWMFSSETNYRIFVSLRASEYYLKDHSVVKVMSPTQ